MAAMPNNVIDIFTYVRKNPDLPEEINKLTDEIYIKIINAIRSKYPNLSAEEENRMADLPYKSVVEDVKRIYSDMSAKGSPTSDISAYIVKTYWPPKVTEILAMIKEKPWYLSAWDWVKRHKVPVSLTALAIILLTVFLATRSRGGSEGKKE